MLDNTNAAESGNMAGQQFVEGTPVLDAAGEKFGTVSEHNVQGGYLVVHKGWLFPRDVYVPLSAVGRSDAQGISLNMYKDELKNQNWENPPENAGMAGPSTGPAQNTLATGGTTVPTNQAGAASPTNITGTTPDATYVEIVEIADHPYFLGCQFHPEFKSKPLEPHPLFSSFVKASYDHGRNRREGRLHEELEMFHRPERIVRR